ncbi:MAG: hypothetical protein PWQ57_2959 [Desulfovibrionales bacterium]|jgi:hypothetical protein|nr:hypothetical protein [Desulfovibrionales bacterium]
MLMIFKNPADAFKCTNDTPSGRELLPTAQKGAHNGRDFSFKKVYVVPNPFDSRGFKWESAAASTAATEDGFAKSPSKT